jgi:hypothetical protein
MIGEETVNIMRGLLRMKFFSLAVLCVVLSASLAGTAANATTQIFVMTPQGVWVASDTLRVNWRSGVRTSETVCKVVIGQSRLFFNAGYFADPLTLEKAEADLPLEDSSITAQKMYPILDRNYMAGRPTQMGGIVQLFKDQVEIALFGYDAARHHGPFEVISLSGVLQGFGGKAFQERKNESLKGADYWRAILADPKGELTKVMESEADTRRDEEGQPEVGRPFTILLLKRDGTIVDYSDTPVCKIPPNLTTSSSSVSNSR